MGHRFMKVHGDGTYCGSDGGELSKPQINLNGKWLAETGFDVGAQIDVEVHKNEIVIRRLDEQIPDNAKTATISNNRYEVVMNHS